jgi:hypothetical protein
LSDEKVIAKACGDASIRKGRTGDADEVRPPGRCSVDSGYGPRLTDKTVWTQRGKLKKKCRFICRFPESKIPADFLTVAEKQQIVNMTPKSLRHAMWPNLFNERGNIRMKDIPHFGQPRNNHSQLVRAYR